jgi:hypothetical protein
MNGNRLLKRLGKIAYFLPGADYFIEHDGFLRTLFCISFSVLFDFFLQIILHIIKHILHTTLHILFAYFLHILVHIMHILHICCIVAFCTFCILCTCDILCIFKETQIILRGLCKPLIFCIFAYYLVFYDIYTPPA